MVDVYKERHSKKEHKFKEDGLKAVVEMFKPDRVGEERSVAVLAVQKMKQGLERIENLDLAKLK